MSKIRKTLLIGLIALVGGVAALGGVALAGGQFTDVSESHPFFEDIEFMASTGISEGFDDGTYRPGEPVTRQAMSAFIHRANSYEVVFSTQLFTTQNIASVEVECPVGTEVVSGGGSANGVNLFMTDSFPSTDGTTWTAEFETDNDANANFSATATAICGPVDVVD